MGKPMRYLKRRWPKTARTLETAGDVAAVTGKAALAAGKGLYRGTVWSADKLHRGTQWTVDKVRDGAREAYDNLGFYASMNAGALIGGNEGLEALLNHVDNHRTLAAAGGYVLLGGALAGLNFAGAKTLDWYHNTHNPRVAKARKLVHRLEGREAATVRSRKYPWQLAKAAAFASLVALGSARDTWTNYRSDFGRATQGIVEALDLKDRFYVEPPVSEMEEEVIETEPEAPGEIKYVSGPGCANQYSSVINDFIPKRYSRAEQRELEKAVKAIIRHESGCNPHAISSAGAVGLMQPMPALSKDYGLDVYVPEEFASIMDARGNLKRDDYEPYSLMMKTMHDAHVRQGIDSKIAELDERFGISDNIRVGTSNLINNYEQFKRMGLNNQEALRFAILSHNMGFNAVRTIVNRDHRTADGAVLYLPRYFGDRRDGPANARQAQGFYRSVNALLKEYED